MTKLILTGLLFLLCGGEAFGLTLVQKKNCPASGAVTTFTCTFTSPTPSGNTIVVQAGGYINTCCSSGQINATDSASNTYALVKNQFQSLAGLGHSTLSVFCATASTTATLTVTATMASAPSDPTFLVINILEYSGLTCTSDGTPVGTSLAQGSSISACDPGNFTSTNANDLIIAAINYSGSFNTQTVTSPWVVELSSASNSPLVYADNTVSSAGVYDPKWTFTATTFSAGCLTAALQLAVTGNGKVSVGGKTVMGGKFVTQ